MKPNQLKKGDQFTLTNRKNAKVYTVTSHPNCKNPVMKLDKPEQPFYGKWLIILDGCGQLFLADDLEIKLVIS